MGGGSAGGGQAATRFSRQEWRSIAREVLTLHEAYTAGGGEFAHGENPIHTQQAGYQFYYLTRNVFRVRRVLEQLPWRAETALARVMPLAERGASGAALNVLDLGCGSGAFSLALLAWLAEGRRPGEELPALRLVLVDQGRALLDLAEANVRALWGRTFPDVPVTVEVHPEGVEAFLGAAVVKERFGIIGAAMMLNELKLLTPGRGGRRAARFADPLRRFIKAGGVAMFVEPGTRKGYMNTMAVRDRLGGWPILYPCPHGQPCPMWSAKVRRWCHATLTLPRPFGFDAELKELGGMVFEMREINLAALVMQAAGNGRVSAPFGPHTGARVVSGRLPARRGAAKKKGGKTGPTGGARKGSEAEVAPAPSVVLCCGADGRLREISAEGLAGQPRGLWLEQGTPQGAQARGGAKRDEAPQKRAAQKKTSRTRSSQNGVSRNGVLKKAAPSARGGGKRRQWEKMR